MKSLSLRWTTPLGLLLAAGASAEPAHVAARVAAAARSVLESLDEKQRRDVSYAFDDEERFDLRLAPLFLEGLPLKRMQPAQERLSRELLGASLSAAGLAKVEAIMSLEVEVERLDRERGGLRWFGRFLRDPKGYFLAIFGEPGDERGWGYRFDGHHVSLNYTVVGAALPSATPLFLGAEPRRVPDGWERQGLRVLAAEEDLARELYLSLDEAQRQRATLPFAPDRELFLGSGRRVALEGPPAGLPRAALDPDQKARLDALIGVYVGNVAAEIAEGRLRSIDAAGRDQIHFAWAGSAQPGQPLYYRVRGPSFLIEFDDSQDEADHVHTLWRDFAGDFGRDLLAAHYAAAHRD